MLPLSRLGAFARTQQGTLQKQYLKHSISRASLSTTSSTLPNDPVIVSFARTPVASFQGDFAGLSAPKLGTIAAKGAIERAGIEPGVIDEAFLGNVIATGQVHLILIN